MARLSSTGATIPTPLPAPHGPEAAETNAQDMREPNSTFSLPKIRLEVRDLCHAGSKAFLSSVVPSVAMEFAVKSVLSLLYPNLKCPTTIIPGTRSVTLILRSMGGVAYTTGLELDDDHKEIHFSIEYISGIDNSRRSDEILGVLVHETVHCYQYNGSGTCPSGLVEGIADWVRLNSNLSPPHWKKEPSEKWDAGYQHTGYFLDYLEQRYGNGTISRMNEKLRTDKYEEKAFWTELLGRPVEQLWGDYQKSVETDRQQLDKVVEENEDGVMIEKDASGEHQER
jgi:basic secretory peptidase family protein